MIRSGYLYAPASDSGFDAGGSQILISGDTASRAVAGSDPVVAFSFEVYQEALDTPDSEISYAQRLKPPPRIARREL